MQELLLAVARGLVEDKEAVQVTVDPMREDGTVVYHLKVAEADMGRVIGKQGRIAKVPLPSVRARKSSLRSTKTRYKALCRRVKCFFQCRGEHCSPTAALRQRRLPRVDAVLHRRGGFYIRPGRFRCRKQTSTTHQEELCKTIFPPARSCPPTACAAK